MIRVHRSTYLLLLCSILLSGASSALIGIDFGSEYYKISTFKKGQLQMVENRYSKTKTYNGVTFYDKTRFLEYDAATKASRSTKNSFIHLLKFFGQDPSSQALLDLSKAQHENNQIQKGEDGSTFFNLDKFVLPREGNTEEERPERLGDDKTVLRLEEIVAMVLEHAKSISESFSDSKVNDVVFTIPPWWSPYEREILYASARLAGKLFAIIF